MRICFCSTILVLVFFQYSLGQILLSGPLSGILPGDTTYLVTGVISVEAGDSLIIQGGAELLFENDTWFNIFGVLLAEGALGDSISFTAYIAFEHWQGIFLMDTCSVDTSRFEFCKILYSGMGALQSHDSNFSLEHSVIFDNTGLHGGGIFAVGTHLEIGNSSLTYNSSPFSGGGLLLENSQAYIFDTEIIYNSSHCGGGIQAEGGQLVVEGCTFNYNETNNGTGGGINCFYTSPIIRNCSFTGNDASDGGGGIYFDNCDSFSVEGCLFTANEGTHRSQLGVFESNGDITGSDFFGGPPFCEGLGLTVQNSTVSLTDCEVSGHHFDSDQGAGIFLDYFAEVSMQNCTVADNIGTGIKLSYAAIEMNDCSLSGNTMGMFADMATVTLDSCIIADNNDGGLFIMRTDFTLTNFTICGNNDFGLRLNWTDAIIDKGIIENNTSTSSGAGISVEGIRDYLELSRVDFIGNTAPQGAGVSFEECSDFLLSNSIFYDNHDSAIYSDNLSTVTISYSCFHNNEGGNFSGSFTGPLGVLSALNYNGDSCDYNYNIFINPEFANPAGGDFHLTTGSPCIDAGDPLSAMDPDSTIADIGAFYFDQSQNVANSNFSIQNSAFSISAVPNPFNSTLAISFQLPADSPVNLGIYDVWG